MVLKDAILLKHTIVKKAGSITSGFLRSNEGF
jgi:hypothetical protein